MLGTAILVVICIIVFAKLLHIINNDNNTILNVKKNRNLDEEDLLSNANNYINTVMDSLSEGIDLPEFVLQKEINWKKGYKHKNIVFTETLNNEMKDNKIIVNLHSINRVHNGSRQDIDILWKFSRRLADTSWLIESVYIKDFVK